ncbi:hypothetical protein SteCoe_31278 [Stentor coeruleus]|uniref:Uncharacterized protein n=1 Tax=Stentor coeruleus TaxID=5963 RepID=A0A1R2B242_9CILI|nr:hypothetical protein SteCoe_31278 [Stentor coeruleus]
MKKVYDFLVLGGGSGGVAAAYNAARYGKKVAVIESQRLGGTCVNLGCVPKKVMWYGVAMIEDFKRANAYGIDLEYSMSFEKLKNNRDEYVKRINLDYESMLKEEKIDYIRGFGKFLDSSTIEVGTESISSKHILIATGSSPLLPDILGKENLSTSDDFFALKSLPKDVLIIGNGYIAAELAGIFKTFGSNVSIAIRGTSFLRGFDQDIGEIMGQIYTKSGIRLLFNTDTKEVNFSGGKFQAKIGEQFESFDKIFAAAGRVPNIHKISLEKAGVKFENGCILTDEYERTNIPGIYAIGDVTSRIKLTPVASAAGKKLVERIFNNGTAKMDYTNIPSVVFSHPPIGILGMTETQAREKFEDVKVYKTSFDDINFALSSHKMPNFMKMICTGKDEKIIGLHVLGRNVDEAMQGFAVAIKMGATKADFENAVDLRFWGTKVYNRNIMTS